MMQNFSIPCFVPDLKPTRPSRQDRLRGGDQVNMTLPPEWCDIMREWLPKVYPPKPPKVVRRKPKVTTLATDLFKAAWPLFERLNLMPKGVEAYVAGIIRNAEKSEHVAETQARRVRRAVANAVLGPKGAGVQRPTPLSPEVLAEYVAHLPAEERDAFMRDFLGLVYRPRANDEDEGGHQG